MRLLVDASGEESLVQVMRDGGDVHEPAAVVFYGNRYRDATDPKVKKTLRGAAKNANFATPYGGSGAKVATTLGLPIREGLQRFDAYKRAFPKLVNLGRVIGRRVREDGYIETTFGRRLYVPRNKPYIGTNYQIQGTAAGILKRAQVRVERVLDEMTGGEAQILLPIHDEVVIEFPRAQLGEAIHVMRRVREVMIDFPQFSVPLDVDFEITTLDWEHKSPFSLED